MKPTRTCNWPPRLDVTLRPSLRALPHRRVRARRSGAMNPALVAVARRRWAGRPAKQRRFEHFPVAAR